MAKVTAAQKNVLEVMANGLMTTVHSVTDSDQMHIDRHGITSREIINVDPVHLDNIARELTDGDWEVAIKMGTYKEEVYWILTAVKYPASALTSQL